MWMKNSKNKLFNSAFDFEIQLFEMLKIWKSSFSGVTYLSMNELKIFKIKVYCKQHKTLKI
jgi:hypothetical protein